MALHFILDGYNIIKAASNASLSCGTLEEQRNRLVGLIRENNPQGSPRNQVTVVFDGKTDFPYASLGYAREHVGEIEIAFSEGGSADDVIEQIVNECPHPAEIVVVTDDRGIHRRLGGTGVRWMGVAEFSSRLFTRKNTHGRSNGLDEKIVTHITDEFTKKWLKD